MSYYITIHTAGREATTERVVGTAETLDDAIGQARRIQIAGYLESDEIATVWWHDGKCEEDGTCYAPALAVHYERGTVARIGDRVVFTDEEDGAEYSGTVRGADENSLDIEFDDGCEGWEPRGLCRIISPEGGAQ